MRTLPVLKLAALSFALLASGSQMKAQTWTVDANGTWSNGLNWLGGSPADAVDAIADFSTLDILANRTVTLDGPRTVGQLRFGDLNGNQNWILTTNAGSDSILTLTTSAGTPLITVNNNAATNRVILGGTQGLVKLGGGSLTLQGSANSFSGTTVVSNGILFLNKAAGVTSIPDDLVIHSGAMVVFTSAADQIADSSVVTVNSGGVLNLNNRSDTIGTLILNGGVVTNNSGSPTLQVTGGFEVRSGEIYSVLAGTGKVLTKTGPGTVVLSANNTYSGGTSISEGVLQIGDGDTTGSPGAGTAAITNNAQLIFNRGAGTALSISGIISGSGSITKLGEGAVSLTGANTYAGSTTISNGVINLSGSSTLGDGTGVLNLSGGTLNITATRSTTTAPLANPINLSADSAITTSSSSATVDLNLTSSLISGTGGTLTFRNEGANDATDLFDPRFSGGNFALNSALVIDNGLVGLTRLNSFNTNGTTQTFNGPISGNGSFRKSIGSGSAGMTVFNGANSYSGTTTVNAGLLLVNGVLGTNVVTIANGATLGGNGTINGATTIQSGGTLSPGVSVGTLTISNALVLATGSKTLIDIDATVHLSDRVVGLTSVNFGGTLQINVIGNLSGGESFQLFSAANYNGSFSSIVLPVLASGLFWNTNNLLANGMLSVISTNAIQQPSITNLVRLADRNLQFSFAGTAGQNYRVWACTNLAAALTTNSWTLLTNAIFGNGTAQFTDWQSTNFPQRFYLISVP